jgi:hypothetical protein
MDYPGKVITKNQVTPTQTSATGVWTLDDAAAATRNNNWPVALVPNPISKSLRFNSADSAYLNRTPSVAGNLRTWTWSGWVKRSALGGAVVRLFNANDSGSPFLQTSLRFDTDQLRFYNDANSTADVKSSAVYRDASAWYHIVCAIDTTQATSSNRVKLYVNGSQVTALATATYPNQNTDMYVNAARAHQIGSSVTPSQFFDGYLTEINFVDGQALTPSSFGMTNPQTGQWIPLKYSGTYGTNGFYLNFKDATSTTTLGYDYSGNANNWTTNNFSVTAGAGNDSLTDVPTPWVAYNTTGDVGGVVRGNYATLNPLIATATLSNGNLDFSQGNTKTAASMGVTSGKWYCEATCNTTANRLFAVGVAKVGDNSAFNLFASGVGYYADDGSKYVDGTNSAYGATYTAGDTIGIALNMDAGTVTFYKNNTSQGSISLPTSSQGYYPLAIQAGSSSTSATWTTNFGQRPFAYTPPTGFRSLCTTNLPATAIGFGLTNQAGKYFNPVLYTGNGGTQTVSGVGFQPDLTWVKDRSAANSNWLNDAVRGAGLSLSSNTGEEEKSYAAYFTAFNSDGFALAGGTGGFNANGDAYVAWNWNAGGSNVTNTSGSITSTVRASTTSGFSVVTYTGNGSAGATFGHGLGVAPSMVIVKNRGAVTDWLIYHTSLGATKSIAFDTAAAITSSTRWNDTAPSSTLITLGTSSGVNGSTNTYVAYCFAAVPGYSAFGSYTGNGSADGPFVFCGFRPRYIMRKRTDSTGSWIAQDSARPGYNATTPYTSVLYPNASDAELSYNEIDILSNGFKIRATDTFGNASGGTYIYAAFAESPFQFANAR